MACRMSVSSNPSVGVILRSVWDGIVEVVRSRLLYLLGGFLIFVSIGKAQSGWAADNTALQLALDALQDILIIPVVIEIYRSLILREAAVNAWANSPPRMWRMIGWTLVLWLLKTVPFYLSNLSPSAIANVIATVAAVMVVIVLLVRFAILFPAIAVDAPGASLGNVWADTSGRTWLIVKTYLIWYLPLLAIVVVAGLITDRVTVSDRLGTLGDNALEFLATIVLTVASARLFDWIGHQVKGLPAGAAQSAEQASSAG